jgi:hypothetical protein
MRPGLVQFSQLVTTSTVDDVLAGFVQIVSSHDRAGAPEFAGDCDEHAMVGAVAAAAAIRNKMARALLDCIEER